jgi:hypothetical protein
MADTQVHCPGLHFRGLCIGETEKGAFGAGVRGEGAMGKLFLSEVRT